MKIPSVWDDCKTEEQKQAFIKKLEDIHKKGKFIPMDDVLFEMATEDLAKNDRLRITISINPAKNRKLRMRNGGSLLMHLQDMTRKHLESDGYVKINICALKVKK